MIEINRHILSNGVVMLHHRDATTRMVALNLLFNVGSKHEQAHRTGLAHLCEHLMFGGTEKTESFDYELQRAGGESNAWTSEDMTCYYEVLPAHNLETAFYLENDRLQHLLLTEKSIAVQKSVVIEEFKQRCLNQPYGDISHILRPLAYSVHPYRVPVIGKSIEQLQQVSHDEVADFYARNYTTQNLIVSVAGGVDFEAAVEMAEKWIGTIPATSVKREPLPVEPLQGQFKEVEVERVNVPHTMLLRAYHMPGRTQQGFEVCDMISDILANGKSSRFFRNVMAKSDLFMALDASVSALHEPGLFYVKARLNDGASVLEAQKVIDEQLQLLANDVTAYEIEKFANKYETNEYFENVTYSEKATKMCGYELLGDVNRINTDPLRYSKITCDEVSEMVRRMFAHENCAQVIYKPKK